MQDQQWIILKMLWTFGCSHTVGHGLPDCVNQQDYSTPLSGVSSQMGWAAELGKHLNMPVTNLGVAGAGTTTVWHRAVTAAVQPNDTVVIMWPCWQSRIDILGDPQNPNNHDANVIAIRNWHRSDEYYFENYYSEYHLWTKWHLQMTHVHYHFTQLRKNDNIKLIQTLYNPYEPEIEPPDFSIFDLTRCYFGHSKYTNMPLALDGSHNGVEANQLFAKELFEVISNAQ